MLVSPHFGQVILDGGTCSLLQLSPNLHVPFWKWRQYLSILSMIFWYSEGTVGLVELVVGLVVVFNGVFLVGSGMEGVLSLLADVTLSESLLSEVDVALFLAGVTSVESVMLLELVSLVLLCLCNICILRLFT